MYREDILRLREDGLTYSQIIDELGCSRSTVAYHVGKGVKTKKIKRQRDRRNKFRKHVAQVKSEAACADCKIDYPPHVLDFDHVRGEKSFTISSDLNSSCGSLRVLKEEIAKCDIVCANCHRERTHKRAVKSGESDSTALNG